MYHRITYQEGDIIQPNCTTRCTCNGNSWNCQYQNCTLDGPSCRVYGDPHYETFYLNYLDIMDNCSYTLSKPLEGDEFVIFGQNAYMKRNKNASQLASVTVMVNSIHTKGLNITIARSRKERGSIYINSIRHPNKKDEVVFHDIGVTVLRTGGVPYVYLTHKYKVGILWDGRREVTITTSNKSKGMLEGVCNYVENDDFILASENKNFTNFKSLQGDNFEAPQGRTDCSEGLMQVAQQRCNVLKKSTFEGCNNVVDPQPYVKSCMFDYCNCPEEEREECYCDVLTSYAAECASAGEFIVHWRNYSFCRKCKYSVKNFLTNSSCMCCTASHCPPGMVYQQCGPVCPQTCHGRTDCIVGCVDGCFCPNGKMHYDGMCIDSLECPGMLI